MALNRRLLLAAFFVWVLLGAFAAGHAAAQDTLRLSVSPSQPTDATGVTVTASGSTGDPSGAVLNVHYRPIATGGCAATPGADTGTAIPPDTSSSGTGAFSFSSTGATQVPIGSYTLCGWLTDDTSALTSAPISTTFAVGAADTLSLSPPAGAIEGQAFGVEASGDVYDASAAIDATFKPAGGSCASSPTADSGVATASGAVPNGSPSYTAAAASELVLNAGSYVVCAWLVDLQTRVVLAQASTNALVHALGAVIGLHFPAMVDPQQEFPLYLSANLPAGVLAQAVAEIVPKRKGTACASNPDGEPTSVTRVIDQSLSDTQVPSGMVATSNSQTGLSSPGSYLVCAWLLDGWSNVSHPSTVAGPNSAVVKVVRPEVFRGETSQRQSITITVATVRRLVTGIEYADRLRCQGTPRLLNGQLWNGSSGANFQAGLLGTVRIGGAGALRVKLNGTASHTFDLAGLLNGRQLTGTFEEQGNVSAFTYNTSQTFRCSTGAVHFKANTS